MRIMPYWMRFWLTVGLAMVNSAAISATMSAAGSAAGTAPLAVAEIDRTLENVRAADLRLAAVGFRLASDNAALCDVRQPGTGLQLHALAQYAPAVRADARRYFAFAGPIAVEGVVTGSPAAMAGVHAGDTLLAIGDVALDQAMPTLDAPATIDPLATVDRQLAALPANAPIRLSVRRAGATTVLVVHPVAACRTRFELLIDDTYAAQADGELVQISSKFLDSYPDDQVAIIVAHELSHNILRHRARLEAAKVDFGMLAEIGKNGRLFRRTETEADQLGVVVLANAGYDPASAARFWRGPGAKIDGGLFRARTHASASARAKITDEVAAGIAVTTPRPIVPGLVATRDQLLR